MVVQQGQGSNARGPVKVQKGGVVIGMAGIQQQEEVALVQAICLFLTRGCVSMYVLY